MYCFISVKPKFYSQISSWRPLRHPLPGEETFPDRWRRGPRDRGLKGAHAPRQHAGRRGRVLLQGIRGGAGDHPVHPRGERRPQPDRYSDRATEQTRSGTNQSLGYSHFGGLNTLSLCSNEVFMFFFSFFAMVLFSQLLINCLNFSPSLLKHLFLFVILSFNFFCTISVFVRGYMFIFKKNIFQPK